MSRYTSRGLDKGFVYPCGKADIVDAFGDELVGSVHFGMYPEFRNSLGRQPHPPVPPNVLLTISPSRVKVPIRVGTMMLVYRVREEVFPDDRREELRLLLRGPIRNWLDAANAKPDHRGSARSELLVSLEGDKLSIFEWMFDNSGRVRCHQIHPDNS